MTFQEDYEQERQDLQLSRQHLCNSEDTVIEQRREIQRLTAENLELRNDLEIEKVYRGLYQIRNVCSVVGSLYCLSLYFFPF